MYTHIDPLLAYEQGLVKKKSLFSSLKQTTLFLFQYLTLTGGIFLLLMGVINYSAYSQRIANWVNPDALIHARDEVNGLLSKATSVTVHASEEANNEAREDLETVKEKILEAEPSVVYSRNYGPEGLLANAGTQDTISANFTLAPYENRLVIPKLGKNVPLVDVMIDHGANFETMHEVFMEELRKGVVRYPGTAEPGNLGNVFIFWHSSNFPWVKSEYNDIFALLDKLEKGDEIIIYYFQKKYVYTVTEHREVKPGDVKTLETRDKTKRELSLMTCWPVGTTLDRLIVFAELNESASTNP
jgi:LPXTG-site transpeptidase (sortase) family protein